MSAIFSNKNSQYRTTATTELNKKYTLIADRHERKICDENGDVIASNNTQCDDTISTKAVFVFTQNGVASTWDPSAVKLYYLKVWEDGILVADFVPCVGIRQGIGLLNKVTGQIYTNSGEGEFGYKAAANWSTFANLIKPIGELPE